MNDVLQMTNPTESNLVVAALKNVQTLESVEQYVGRFRVTLSKTASSIIELGEIVYSAKTELNKDGFKLFCLQIGTPSNSSTIKKWIKIGEKAQTLRKHENHLPSDWTTVYQLARLTETQINDLIKKVDDGCVISGTLLRDISEPGTKRPPTLPRTKPLPISFRIVDEISPEVKKKIDQAVREILKEANVQIAEVEMESSYVEQSEADALAAA